MSESYLRDVSINRPQGEQEQGIPGAVVVDTVFS